VPDTIAHREELWSQCNDDLMLHVRRVKPIRLGDVR
jgi:hypothetical protein